MEPFNHALEKALYQQHLRYGYLNPTIHTSLDAVSGSKELDRLSEAFRKLRLEMLEAIDNHLNPLLEGVKTHGVEHGFSGGPSDLADMNFRPFTIADVLQVWTIIFPVIDVCSLGVHA